MTVGVNIKRIRKERGITQKQLGELCGIAEPNIRKYENGKQNPKLETVEKIATALGVTAFELMGMEYFDLKNPDAAKQYAEYNSFQNYIQSLGYTIEEIPERGDEDGITAVTRTISGNGITAILTDEEYQHLQAISSDLIFSFLKNKPPQQK